MLIFYLLCNAAVLKNLTYYAQYYAHVKDLCLGIQYFAVLLEYIHLQNKIFHGDCYIRVYPSLIIFLARHFVALCCIRSSLSIFLAKYGFQIETQYSNCGRMYVLYSIRNDSFVKWIKVLFISPRDCMALAEALSQCIVKLDLDVIQTPKSYSEDTTLNLEFDLSSFI